MIVPPSNTLRTTVVLICAEEPMPAALLGMRFQAPIGLARFRRVLDAATLSHWWRRHGERRGERPRRQQVPHTERADDGTLLFVDGEGTR